ncbi:hypothetical protein [Streptomyces sp. HC307]|uniref:hypothetical protein n=1 Tax=Streptomyces flavusporus TaxID=3385496 RepID=UPI003916D526
MSAASSNQSSSVPPQNAGAHAPAAQPPAGSGGGTSGSSGGGGSPSTTPSHWEQRYQRVNTIATIAAALFAIASLVISGLTYRSQLNANETQDKAARVSEREVILSTVSKVVWYFRWKTEDKPEFVAIENRGLSPIYDVALQGIEDDVIKQSYLPGDIPPCSRITVQIDGAKNSEKVRTDLDFSLAFSDFRGNNWWLNPDRSITRVAEFGRVTDEEEKRIVKVPDLIDQKYETSDLDACG